MGGGYLHELSKTLGMLFALAAVGLVAIAGGVLWLVWWLFTNITITLT